MKKNRGKQKKKKKKKKKNSADRWSVLSDEKVETVVLLVLAMYSIRPCTLDNRRIHVT